MFTILCGIIGLLLLGCVWLLNEWTFRTKLILTLVYGLTWLLLFADAWLFVIAQDTFILAVGTSTFGGRIGTR